MNPEDNQPLSNPFATGASAPSGSAPLPNTNNPVLPDSLTSAQDNNLTAAGMTANQGSGAMSLGQIAEDDPSAATLPQVEEPLVPAAPVPGSIGSAVSVPPADPAAAPAFGTPGEATAPSSPAAAPQAAPYNPFSTSSAAPAVTSEASAPQPLAAPTKLNSSLRPAPTPVKEKSGKNKSNASPLTIILGGLALVLLVTTIIFFILWNQARNNPKIVYTPSVAEENSNAAIATLTCHRNETREAPAGSGATDIEVVYTSDALSALSSILSLDFANAEDANATRDANAGTVDMMTGVVGGTLSVSGNVNGNNYTYSITSQDGVDVAPNDAMNVIYGTVEGEPSLAMGDVKAKYEADGFTCAAE